MPPAQKRAWIGSAYTKREEEEEGRDSDDTGEKLGEFKDYSCVYIARNQEEQANILWKIE